MPNQTTSQFAMIIGQRGFAGTGPEPDTWEVVAAANQELTCSSTADDLDVVGRAPLAAWVVSSSGLPVAQSGGTSLPLIPNQTGQTKVARYLAVLGFGGKLLFFEALDPPITLGPNDRIKWRSGITMMAFILDSSNP